MNIWFYSDPHFGHEALLQPSAKSGGKIARPEFATVDDMNETIVDRHNALVRPQDHVYCLGDFAMKKLLVETWAKRLNGHKRLILGNHDIFEAEFYLRFFEKVMSYRFLDGMCFSHIPVAPWSVSSMTANIHGHCHLGKPLFYSMANPDHEGFVKSVKYIHISVERTNYQPVSLDQLKAWSRK